MSEAPPSGLRVEVLVLPKEGMLDPEGEAVERVLKSPLGFNVNNVRIGRLYELILPQDIDPTEARRIVGEICTETAVLVNPLVESHEIKIVGDDKD